MYLDQFGFDGQALINMLKMCSMPLASKTHYGPGRKTIHTHHRAAHRNKYGTAPLRVPHCSGAQECHRRKRNLVDSGKT